MMRDEQNFCGVSFDVMRHGQTVMLAEAHVLRGQTEDPLTPLGYQQMADAFERHYPQRQWQAVITSPLLRCADFAKDVSRLYGLPCVCFDELMEIDFGDWEGMDTQELFDKYPQQLETYWLKPTQFTPPNAESVQDFAHRMVLAVQKIHAISCQHGWHSVCVIAHGGVIKALTCLAKGQSLDSILSVSAEFGTVHRFDSADFLATHRC